MTHAPETGAINRRQISVWRRFLARVSWAQRINEHLLTGNTRSCHSSD